jgi:hypothetical protein
MATKTYVLSSPPKTTAKTHSRRASASGDVRMSLTPTRVAKPNSDDAEMRGSSDGWETQDSAWGMWINFFLCGCVFIGGSWLRIWSFDVYSSWPVPRHSASAIIPWRTLYTRICNLTRRCRLRPQKPIPFSLLTPREIGIQFIARLPGVVPPLLSAPLPLALESMRRIPALKLLGTMKLSPDTARLDTEIDVRLCVYCSSPFSLVDVTILRIGTYTLKLTLHMDTSSVCLPWGRNISLSDHCCDLRILIHILILV